MPHKLRQFMPFKPTKFERQAPELERYSLQEPRARSELPCGHLQIKLREWSQKLINAMGQVDLAYKTAISNIMKLAVADQNPDLDHGWPGADKAAGASDKHEVNSAQLDKDLRNVRMEKGGWHDSH